MSELKEIIKDRDSKVYFMYYRDGDLWYKTDTNFEFPVPVSDIGNATFLAEDRSILFMRYIRKHLQTIEETKKEQNE